jgi:hypothetical protein
MKQKYQVIIRDNLTPVEVVLLNDAIQSADNNSNREKVSFISSKILYSSYSKKT